MPMISRRTARFLAALLLLALKPALLRGLSAPAPAGLGLFESHGDIGTVLHPGSVRYDPSAQTYTVTGSGENMWFAADAFQFAWKKASGDVGLAADISFVGSGGNAHRKGVLMIRQSLDADSVYVDVARHGNGLTSLQYRDSTGGATHEIQSNLSAPRRLRIEKRGDYIYLWLSAAGDTPEPAGAAVRVQFHEPFYIGIGVCSHDKDVSETAVFSRVRLGTSGSGEGPLSGGAMAQASGLYSTLETVDIASTDRRVVYVAQGRFEAPNWTPDGASLVFNRNGRIERIAVAGGTPETVDTGFATRCNNDHGISADGALLAVSDQSQGASGADHGSLIYILPLAGGVPRRVTEYGPSYWHGWSPDGKTICFCGERKGRFDVYTIPAAGGGETQLTQSAGHNDGPEYSPDGRAIYFNSDRTGAMQIWRMSPDGSDQEELTSDEFNNWFPHISPDGKWMAFLSYAKDVSGHPADKEVTLRLMSLADRRISVLATLFGGQGTINVPSWSPDSKRLAFVSYEVLPSD
jgi:TolB protein